MALSNFHKHFKIHFNELNDKLKSQRKRNSSILNYLVPTEAISSNDRSSIAISNPLNVSRSVGQQSLPDVYIISII